MIYTIRQKRGNKRSVAIGTFFCESNDAADLKECFRKHLWLMGVSVAGYKKYCFEVSA